MSTAANEVSLEKIAHLSLEQFIPTKQEQDSFPIPCQLTSTTLSLDKNCRLGASKNVLDSKLTPSKNSDIELIVFSTISFEQLSQIVKQCKLTITSLMAINSRNNLVSYRFATNCDDLTLAKTALADLTLSQNIEAAIIKQAPKLATAGVLVMDMDSTVIEIECIDEIAALAGVGKQVAEVTELAMQGKLDFAQSLHQRVATLKGAPESILASVAADIPLMPGLETLVDQLKQQNWTVAIASGGFTYFADHLKQLLALDAAHANVLEIVDGKLTGKVLGNVVDAQAKADCLLSLQQQKQLPHCQTVAMGDGANDLVMMNAAHLGVAFHAKPIVLKQADSTISHSGLDCLLHWLA